MKHNDIKIKYIVYCFPLSSDGTESTIGDVYVFQSAYHVLPRNERTFVTNQAILNRPLWCDYAK